jgi:hypothetical protein
MKRVLSCAAGLLLLSTLAVARDQTWTGQISDSMCGRSHKAMMEHGDKKMTDHDCTIACVKGGAKYVFVSGGKIFNIENQSFAGLEDHAAHQIKLTGEMKGDAITVSRIDMLAQSPTKP